MYRNMGEIVRQVALVPLFLNKSLSKYDCPRFYAIALILTREVPG